MNSEKEIKEIEEIEEEIREKYEAISPYLNEKTRKVLAAMELKSYGHDLCGTSTMSSKKKVEKEIKKKYEAISPYLNEKSRRIWAAVEVKSYGRGGISLVYRATGITYKTIKRGLEELEQGYVPSPRLRKMGGGRKKITHKEPLLIAELTSLLNRVTLADPESSLFWICKSIYQLTKELQEKGHKVYQQSICNTLGEMGYTLHPTGKIKERKLHPDKNAQFEYINEKVNCFQRRNQPVIFVNTLLKENKKNIGYFETNEQEYQSSLQSQQINVDNFLESDTGKVMPYDIYDLTRNNGWGNVGISHDTVEFTVESIRAWWYQMGKPIYQNATELYITVNCGGMSGHCLKLWKKELQKLTNQLNIIIHISHFPLGTSKWNKIEHRMLSFIFKNWPEKSFVDRVAVVNLISHTITQANMPIKTRIDENTYETGHKISAEELSNLNLKKDSFYGEWNYQISPKK